MSELPSDDALCAFMTEYARQRSTSTVSGRPGLAAVKAEAYSADEAVWACADGQGFVEALMIDDKAIAANTVQDLEDLISDALVDASSRGQAEGTIALSTVKSAYEAAGLKSRNGKRISTAGDA
ncbi:YbaB/EbfC family nucleoid-associated protein [Mycolicibacterium porcinum]|uniref:YbaB/EbfC family nucleoid-associated protein n=1 Tax=Mycolicibacterium porcinum TaxID=39693 RepID=A0ABV3VJE7_9MYCO